MEQKQEAREKLNQKRGIEGDTEEKNGKLRKGGKKEKEWKKEDKIIYVRRCKIWSNQYKEIKRELEGKRILHKNKRIETITKEIRQNIKKGNARKVWQRLNEMKQGGKMKGGGLALNNNRGEKRNMEN